MSAKHVIKKVGKRKPIPPAALTSSSRSEFTYGFTVDGDELYTNHTKRIETFVKFITEADGICVAQSWTIEKRGNRVYDYGFNKSMVRVYRCSTYLSNGKAVLAATRFADTTRQSRSGSEQDDFSQISTESSLITTDHKEAPSTADIIHCLQEESAMLDWSNDFHSLFNSDDSSDEPFLGFDTSSTDSSDTPPSKTVKRESKSINDSLLNAFQSSSFQDVRDTKSKFISRRTRKDSFHLKGNNYDKYTTKRQKALQQILMKKGIACKLVFGSSFNTQYCFIENASCVVKKCCTFSFKLTKEGKKTLCSVSIHGEPKHSREVASDDLSVKTNAAVDNDEPKHSREVASDDLSARTNAAVDNDSMAQENDYKVDDYLLDYQCNDSDEGLSLKILLKGHTFFCNHVARRRILKKIFAFKQFPCFIMSKGAQFRRNYIVDYCFCRFLNCRKLPFKCFADENNVLRIECTSTGFSHSHGIVYEVSPSRPSISASQTSRKRQSKRIKEITEQSIQNERILGVMLHLFLAENSTQVDSQRKRQDYLVDYIRSTLNLKCDIAFVCSDHERDSFVDYAACKTANCRMMIFNLVQGENGYDVYIKIFGKSKHSGDLTVENFTGGQIVYLDQIPKDVVQFWERNDGVSHEIQGATTQVPASASNTTPGFSTQNMEKYCQEISHFLINIDRPTVEMIFGRTTPRLFGPSTISCSLLCGKDWLFNSSLRKEKLFRFLREKDIEVELIDSAQLYYEGQKTIDNFITDIEALIDYLFDPQTGSMMQFMFLSNKSTTNVQLITARYESRNVNSTRQTSTAEHISSVQHASSGPDPSPESNSTPLVDSTGQGSSQSLSLGTVLYNTKPLTPSLNPVESQPSPNNKKDIIPSVKHNYVREYDGLRYTFMASVSINSCLLHKNKTFTMYLDVVHLPFIKSESLIPPFYCAGVVNIGNTVVPLLEVITCSNNQFTYSKALRDYVNFLVSKFSIRSLPFSEIVVNCSINLILSVCDVLDVGGLTGYLNTAYDLIYSISESPVLTKRFISIRICSIQFLNMIARKLDSFPGVTLKLKELVLVTIADMFKCESLSGLETIFGSLIKILMSKHGSFSIRSDSTKCPCIIIMGTRYDPLSHKTSYCHDYFDFYHESFSSSPFYHIFKRTFVESREIASKHQSSYRLNEYFHPELAEYLLKSIMPMSPFFTLILNPILEKNKIQVRKEFVNLTYTSWIDTIKNDIVKSTKDMTCKEFISLLSNHLFMVAQSI